MGGAPGLPWSRLCGALGAGSPPAAPHLPAFIPAPGVGGGPEWRSCRGSSGYVRPPPACCISGFRLAGVFRRFEPNARFVRMSMLKNFHLKAGS